MTSTRSRFQWQWAAVLLLVGGILLGAAGTARSPLPVAAQGTTAVKDQAGLIAALRKAGLAITAAGLVHEPFLAPTGQAFTVNHVKRDTIAVFTYPSAAAAARDTAKIRPDATIPGMAIDWIAQPHFYRSGRIIVIYPGANAKLLAVLRAVAGKPFAVGPKH